MKITITDVNGTVIEQGDATVDRIVLVDRWEFKATTANPSLTGTKITATAFDRPGNRGMAEVVL